MKKRVFTLLVSTLVLNACLTESDSSSQDVDENPIQSTIDTIVTSDGDTIVVLEDGTNFLIGEAESSSSSAEISESQNSSTTELSSENLLSSQTPISSDIELSSTPGSSSSSSTTISSSIEVSSSSVGQSVEIELAFIGYTDCNARGYENYDKTRLYEPMTDTLVVQTGESSLKGGIYVSVDHQIDVHPSVKFRAENLSSGKPWEEDVGTLAEYEVVQKWVHIGECSTMPIFTSGVCEGFEEKDDLFPSGLSQDFSREPNLIYQSVPYNCSDDYQGFYCNVTAGHNPQSFNWKVVANNCYEYEY